MRYYRKIRHITAGNGDEFHGIYLFIHIININIIRTSTNEKEDKKITM